VSCLCFHPFCASAGQFSEPRFPLSVCLELGGHIFLTLLLLYVGSLTVSVSTSSRYTLTNSLQARLALFPLRWRLYFPPKRWYLPYYSASHHGRRYIYHFCKFIDIAQGMSVRVGSISSLFVRFVSTWYLFVKPSQSQHFCTYILLLQNIQLYLLFRIQPFVIRLQNV
jgi:hypothetical protein